MTNISAGPAHGSLLVAEDDPDDRLLLSEAIALSHPKRAVEYVEDGVELLDFLRRRNAYVERIDSPPALVLLDLNMPRMDGREALHEIKADPVLRRIPIVVLTTSGARDDILSSYDLGVNSFVVKPVTFTSLVELVASLAHYWFDVVELPSGTTM